MNLKLRIKVKSQSCWYSDPGFSAAIMVAISLLFTSGELTAEANPCQLGCELLCNHAVDHLSDTYLHLLDGYTQLYPVCHETVQVPNQG